ncbi:MAG: toxin-antitoxin system HicB family antitoxin [Blastocatellia bacterium]|nr:toxin-antitoxin system HicB family antitoxin [Blastocatellia bacterium]
MQTTLRIEDEIYRKAKAEAAREGITLTRFIEEALRLRLGGEATGEQNVDRGDYSALVERLERLFEQADERDRLKKGSAGPFSRQELYAERLERFR